MKYGNKTLDFALIIIMFSKPILFALLPLASLLCLATALDNAANLAGVQHSGPGSGLLGDMHHRQRRVKRDSVEVGPAVPMAAPVAAPVPAPVVAPVGEPVVAGPMSQRVKRQLVPEGGGAIMGNGGAPMAAVPAMGAVPVQSGSINPARRTKREIEETIPRDKGMRWSRCLSSNQSIYDAGLKIQDLQGNPLDLEQFRGKILLIVNVATFCAYTEHYLDFGPLLQKHQDLRILTFPSNQFGLQEPGKNEEILNGIRYVRPGNNYILPKNVHMMSKIDVNGEKEIPMYSMLKSICPATVRDIGKHQQIFWNPIRVNDVTWNFEKFLIDKEGMPRFRFHPTAWNHGLLLTQFLNELSTGQKVKSKGGANMLAELIENEVLEEGAQEMTKP